MIKLIETIGHDRHAPEVEYDHDRVIPYRETPNRAELIRDYLLELGLAEIFAPQISDPSPSLSAIHTLPYLEALPRLSQAASEAGRYLYPYIFPVRPSMERIPDLPFGLLGRHSIDVGSPVGPGTWSAAVAAAQAAIAAADLLVTDPTCLPYALCRPPGHHSGRDFMGGYCYLNNAAAAAQRLKSRGRVAIIDIDYHHGNGTQDIFWDDPDVFFLSLHGDPQFEYPNYAGFSDERGGVLAPGTILNCPLPRLTNADQYLATLTRGLEAVIRYSPATIVVSLGFDTYRDDPLSSFALDLDAFPKIAHRIASLHLPTLLIQEGGYASDVLPRLAAAFLEGWGI
ncbi:MAG: histone deacetylase family protein [Anaerolineae bacterium]|nr:MAG: histone deacetylase family protein [Anaerolineae bacterium]